MQSNRSSMKFFKGSPDVTVCYIRLQQDRLRKEIMPPPLPFKDPGPKSKPKPESPPQISHKPSREILNAMADAGAQFSPEMLGRLNREDAEAGELEIALMWNTSDDLDLHVMAPSGEKIYYGNEKSACGGWLDVDMNVTGGGDDFSLQPVEHIRWLEGEVPEGEYHVYVELFTYRSDEAPVPFTVCIKANNKVKEYYM